ncbi:MAG: VWA domain-containing protein [Acidobacteria bacterium]|nr:VWA domain-containing protein [Acidobacteriota bacterium]
MTLEPRAPRAGARRRRACRAALLLAAAALCLAAPAAAQDKPPAAPALPSEVQEKVEVRLAEVQILVTDKKGNPITDLKPEEVQVLERGKERRIGYLEPFATRNLVAQPTAPRAAVPEQKAEPAPAAPAAKPAPLRWIVILFDFFNSRTQDRTRWVEAARGWVQKDMRPGDRVCIASMVLHGDIRILAPFTDKPEVLMSLLQHTGFVDQTPMQDYTMDIRRLMDDLQTCVPAHEPAMCSLAAVQPYLAEWNNRAVATLNGLKRLSGWLAAIPGRKAVMLMSSGFLSDPGDIVQSAVLATFGTDAIPINTARTLYARDTNFDVLAMLRAASTAQTTFYTFDTRPSNLRDASFEAEQRVRMHERRGADPFASIFDSSRASMDTLAMQTGGRSFNGPAIEKSLPLAMRSIEGLYTIGFYRDPVADRKLRIKVRVSRKGVEVSTPDRYDPRVNQPVPAPMELALAKPRSSPQGMVIPVLLQVPVRILTFEKTDLGETAQVSVYAEAISSAGERFAESFEQVEVALAAAQSAADKDKNFGHSVNLVVPPGSYIVRVRLSEADLKVLADRSLAFTVNTDGTIRAGVQEVGRDQDAARSGAETEKTN